MGAAHLSVSLTMTDSPAHGLPGHACVWAGVVGLVTNDQAVLIGVITMQSHCTVTRRGLGQLPTSAADSILTSSSSTSLQGAVLRAAVLITR